MDSLTFYIHVLDDFFRRIETRFSKKYEGFDQDVLEEMKKSIMQHLTAADDSLFEEAIFKNHRTLFEIEQERRMAEENQSLKAVEKKQEAIAQSSSSDEQDEYEMFQYNLMKKDEIHEMRENELTPISYFKNEIPDFDILGRDSEQINQPIEKPLTDNMKSVKEESAREEKDPQQLQVQPMKNQPSVSKKKAENEEMFAKEWVKLAYQEQEQHIEQDPDPKFSMHITGLFNPSTTKYHKKKNFLKMELSKAIIKHKQVKTEQFFKSVSLKLKE